MEKVEEFLVFNFPGTLEKEKKNLEEIFAKKLIIQELKIQFPIGIVITNNLEFKEIAKKMFLHVEHLALITPDKKLYYYLKGEDKELEYLVLLASKEKKQEFRKFNFYDLREDWGNGMQKELEERTQPKEGPL